MFFSTETSQVPNQFQRRRRKGFGERLDVKKKRAAAGWWRERWKWDWECWQTWEELWSRWVSVKSDHWHHWPGHHHCQAQAAATTKPSMDRHQERKRRMSIFTTRWIDDDDCLHIIITIKNCMLTRNHCHFHHFKEFCVDVSTYEPVEWVEEEAETCETVFVKVLGDDFGIGMIFFCCRSARRRRRRCAKMSRRPAVRWETGHGEGISDFCKCFVLFLVVQGKKKGTSSWCRIIFVGLKSWNLFWSVFHLPLFPDLNLFFCCSFLCILTWGGQCGGQCHTVVGTSGVAREEESQPWDCRSLLD